MRGKAWKRWMSAAALCLPAIAGADDRSPIDAYVEAEMARQRIPGVAVAVIRDGEPVHLRGYGTANVEHAVPVSPDTVFQSGSIGKQFTAVAALLMVEDGQLSLDAPLTTWLPQAPAHWSKITVRHLLNHTSGLGQPELDPRREYSDEELLQAAYAASVEFRPGERWRYCNMGYVVLGVLIGRVGGRPYGEVLAERVFAPLGMRSARVISDSAIVPHRAAGYQLDERGLRNQDWASASINATADGSLYLSLRDYVQWERGVRERRILRPASWQQALRPARLNDGSDYPYGFGWTLGRDGAGGLVMGHGGAWQGFRSQLLRYDGDAVGFVVLANVDAADTGAVLAGVAERYHPRYARPRAGAVDDPAPALSRRLAAAVRRLRAGELAAADFPELPAERIGPRLEDWRALLNRAGDCASPKLYRDRGNGDTRERIYRLRCERGLFELKADLQANGRLRRFQLSPIAAMDAPFALE